MSAAEAQRVEQLEAIADALAKALRHCPHACVPPCPHTRQAAPALSLYTNWKRPVERHG